MAISQEKLMEALQRSKQIVAKTENAPRKGAKSAQLYNPSPDDFNEDTGDGTLFGGYHTPSDDYKGEFSPYALEHSKIPSAIKEAIVNSAANESASIIPQIQSAPAQSRPTVNEQVRYQAPVPAPSYANAGGVDYSIIKAIVNECLRDYGKTAINESAQISTIALKEGKIKLVDNKGNVYSAKLEYKGNVNDKK